MKEKAKLKTRNPKLPVKRFEMRNASLGSEMQVSSFAFVVCNDNRLEDGRKAGVLAGEA